MLDRDCIDLSMRRQCTLLRLARSGVYRRKAAPDPDDLAVMKRGGSGGVGTLAVQFAKLRGARVLATGSGLEGAELVREMGADMAIDGKHEDIAEAARRVAPDGIDAILALAGGEALSAHSTG
jgi:NADPH:quinone reductase-like Zn-dependent oxidoreductase